MLRKNILPVVGCALLLVSACSKSEPTGTDSSTPVSGKKPAAQNSTGDTQKEQSGQEETPKSTETQKLEASSGPGIKVGEKAPAFKLKDQNGKVQAPENLIKQGSVALVFYRSADW